MRNKQRYNRKLEKSNVALFVIIPGVTLLAPIPALFPPYTYLRADSEAICYSSSLANDWSMPSILNLKFKVGRTWLAYQPAH